MQMMNKLPKRKQQMNLMIGNRKDSLTHHKCSYVNYGMISFEQGLSIVLKDPDLKYFSLYQGQSRLFLYLHVKCHHYFMDLKSWTCF